MGRVGSLSLDVNHTCIRVNDEWTEHLDEGGYEDVIYMDFKKAFDTVPLRRFLAKISNYGIREKVLANKQKTTSGSEWLSLKIGRGAERDPTGKCIRTGRICYVFQ